MDIAARKAAELVVACLENEGVEYIFGLPGEENIDVMDALLNSKIRFILTRHEQAAAFMAEIYGRLTNKAGVCLATLGPGAINLLLGVADAQLDSAPLVALAGQASIDRLNKESHQVIDLVNMFQPVTKWSSQINLAESTAETMRKAFKVAQTDRYGATMVVLPEDIAKITTKQTVLKINQPKFTEPNSKQIDRAAKIINQSKEIIILAGHGVCRHNASEALREFAAKIDIPVATTFLAKGVISNHDPLCLGPIGFMKHDYANFGFDQADTVITIGYDLVEYAPKSWNPGRNKQIIHIHTVPAEVDENYELAVGLEGDISQTLNTLVPNIKHKNITLKTPVRDLITAELTSHDQDDAFPIKPQRIVSDLRKAVNDNAIVLCDTGALKMWVARLFPCYEPNTCIFSNGLSTMGFAVPGAIAAKIAFPNRKIIAVTGDGSFMMNSQEIETAKREGVSFVILIWHDDSYGLIEWKQKIEFGRSSHIKFTNPDFVKYAESFGVRGYRVNNTKQLLPILKTALDSDEICVIDCPVDYSENMQLIEKLAELNA